MKQIFLAIVLIIAFSCKNDKKEVVKPKVKEEVKKEVITKLEVPVFLSWGKQRVELKESELNYGDEKGYVLSRASTSKSCFAHTQNIAVEYGSDYRASIIVKKENNSNFFGLRLSGTYPDRVDAVFDLKSGAVKGVKNGRDFENGDATIESLGDGWYKCSVKVTVAADSIRIIFGPTNDKTNINGWEGKIENPRSVFIIPNSLSLEKTSFE
ncbi:MAG: hypothetical protein ACI93N_002092 [Flavobacteriaceae bacterium]|jgi:hypothetical protein